MSKGEHSVSKESLHHFNCGDCGKWWTIGDIAGGTGGIDVQNQWFCPWCGEKKEAKQ